MVVGTTLQTLSKLRNADRQAAALAQMREKVLADTRLGHARARAGLLC